MNPDTPMKTPDYKHLAKIGAEAAKCCIHWSEINETFARAVIEEYDRLRMAEDGEGMPSVEECIRVWHRSGGINQGPEAVRNLMLAAFEKKLEEFAALEERHRETTTLLQECVQKFNLGLGGERIDKLVVEALTESTAKLAAAEKRLGELEWRPVSVKPTAADGDAEGTVFVCSADGKSRGIHKIEWPFSTHVTHWFPFPKLSAPTAEDVSRAEFEKAYLKQNPNTVGWAFQRAVDGSYFQPATLNGWQMWQAARASKEVKAADE